jgi:hypothetical protein
LQPGQKPTLTRPAYLFPQDPASPRVSAGKGAVLRQKFIIIIPENADPVPENTKMSKYLFPAIMHMQCTGALHLLIIFVFKVTLLKNFIHFAMGNERGDPGRVPGNRMNGTCPGHFKGDENHGNEKQRIIIRVAPRRPGTAADDGDGCLTCQCRGDHDRSHRFDPGRNQQRR